MQKISKTNLVIMCVMLTLTVLGLIMIYSASSYSAMIKYDDAFHFVKKQAFGVVLGMVLFIVAYKFDYHRYVKLRWLVLGVSILALILVFVPGVGISANGSRRWIGFGSLNLQSSELAKFGFVIFVSCYMAKNYDKMKTFKGLIPVLISGGIMCLLIILEPNMSVTMCVGFVMVLMLIIGGIKLKHFLILAVPALMLVPLLIIIEPYRLSRLTAFLNPWQNPMDEGYQLIQSLYSLGAGGLFGVGLFNSRQKYLFLPFSESDFIFSIIGEELGLLGAMGVILLYIVIITLGIKIAISAKDRLGSYMAFGIVAVLATQVLINVAVVTGSIPPTGIPLPFVSAGGTSVSIFMGAIGVLWNIGKGGQTTKAEIFNKQT
ncbi:MAG: putative lipid II flippase FtsW, partial [Clostridia bacterium]|nr:putative lipid II flippase FtsW [Clostridia bacterium]